MKPLLIAMQTSTCTCGLSSELPRPAAVRSMKVPYSQRIEFVFGFTWNVVRTGHAACVDVRGMKHVCVCAVCWLEDNGMARDVCCHGHIGFGQYPEGCFVHFLSFYHL